MAKKLNAKQKRELAEQAKQEKYRKLEADRKAAEEAERIKREAEARERLVREEEARLQREREAAEQKARERAEQIAREHPELMRVKKSRAKAAGLKSTFVIGDELLMTSFGKGNDAVVEHHIRHDGITSLQAPPAFRIDDYNTSFAITGRNRLSATADDPRRATEMGTARLDMIGAKSELEKRFFGRTFDDNIHVQLIYNILDMEKILAKHINNIVYAINNIRGIAEDGIEDFIGYMGMQNSFDTFSDPERYRNPDKKREASIRASIASQKAKFDALLKNPRLGYFGSAFYNVGSDKKARKKSDMRSAEQIYYMICLLGEARQALAHSSNSTREALYRLDTVREPARATLDALYAERVDTLNADFIKHAEKDLTILFRITEVSSYEEKKRLAADYYDFVVRKSYKNIGFSIKKLRERLMDHFFERKGLTADDPSFSSVRQKFYRLLDFVIFSHYRAQEARIAQNVERLRASLNELEKEMFYVEESERLWRELQTVITDKLYTYMNGTAIKTLETDAEISSEMIGDVLIRSDAVEYFSKMIYMLTLFIDGKEINDLLTTLIHQFENIASFLFVLRERGLSESFTEGYAMFLRAEKIARELREINSFARMERPTPSAKKQMYLDAATLLGTSASEQELTAYFDALLDRKQDSGKTGKTRDNTLRNFIASNVIESDRFIYIVRYNNIRNARLLAQNKKVITFVLNQIPDTQIARYCKTCAISVLASREAQVAALAELIAEMDFSRFEHVPSAKERDKKRGEERQRLQGMIGLYLTVLYLLTKNLVNVNSRYFLAFHCLERDGQLLGISAGYKGANYGGITSSFIDGGKLNRHASSYLRTNLANADDWATRLFRNNVAHLGAIRGAYRYIGDIKSVRSYFELYHYLIQRHIEAAYDRAREAGWSDIISNEKTIAYLPLARVNGWYCKDFVKAYCIPFGYNLPRYKNLTIDALFDRNNPPETDGETRYRCKDLVD